MERVEVNGVELEFEVRGTGEPVLLIDMLIADCFVPLLTEPSLANRHQLIRYHKRGWRGSTHTPPPVSIEDHADDAAALLDHLGDTARSHRGALDRRVDRSPNGAGPSRKSPLAHSSRADAGITSSRPGVPESGEPGVRRVRKRRPRGSVRHVRHCRKRARMGRVPAHCSRSGSPAWPHGRSRTRPPSSAWSCRRYWSGPSDPSRRPPSTSQSSPSWVPKPSLYGLRSPTSSCSSLPYIEERTIEGVGHLLQIQRPEPVARAMAAFLGRNHLGATSIGSSASTTALLGE